MNLDTHTISRVARSQAAFVAQRERFNASLIREGADSRGACPEHWGLIRVAADVAWEAQTKDGTVPATARTLIAINKPLASSVVAKWARDFNVAVGRILAECGL